MKISKIPRIARVLVTFIISIALLICGVTLDDKLTLANRITDSVNERITVRNIFTAQKLIAKHESTISFNGDEETGGTFQLTKQEIGLLASSSKPLKCTQSKLCHIKNEGYTATGTICIYATGDPDVSYFLCLNLTSYQADWSLDYT